MFCKKLNCLKISVEIAKDCGIRDSILIILIFLLKSLYILNILIIIDKNSEF